jgi:nicotinate (nicotinamide) nucleotide adenylyltransferase
MPRASLAIFPGSFNPPTKAHMALIAAARRQTDRVLAVLPREFPHKTYDNVTLEQRVQMLEALREELDFSIHIAKGGLFIDIARECRLEYGSQTELWFVCGRDAAQRIVEWDYGHPHAIRHMLDEFGLLVASRQGEYEPPAELAHKIRRLELPASYDAISATEVRRRIANGEPWRELVPEAALDLISRFYEPRPSQSKSG